MVVVVEGEVCYSDSDSDDDDDVDRYVFLARQPAPAPAVGRHADDDRGASSANDGDGEDDGDDDDATADEEEPERGGGRRKRRPLGREILDGAPPPPPPPPKKAPPVELIAPPIAHTPPSGSGSETESDSAAALPCVDVRAGESGSEGSHDDHEKVHRRRAPGRRAEAKNAKRVACGKRGRGPGCEADGDRAVTVTAAAKAGAPPPAATSGRFLCNLCERCFGSYQALGGHVLGHRKKARIATAAAAGLDDVDDAGGVIGNRKEETAVVEANSNEAASGIAQADKMVAVAARRGKANGGGCHGKIKTVDGVAERRDDDVGFGNGGNGITVSSNGFTNNGGNSRSNGKTGIGASIPNQKVIAGSCHEGAAANGDGNGVRRTMYKCKVCGTECPTGRALGGHMRKHRKRPPLGGGGEDGRSPSPPPDDDCQIPLSRLFAAENTIGLI